MIRLFKKLKSFFWDVGNVENNRVKHSVNSREAEEVFFSSGYFLSNDLAHSEKEKRYTIIGPTKSGRLLTITFTLRKLDVRVISARAASKKERNVYEKTSKNSKIQR